MSSKNILVIRTDRIGELLLTSPVCDALKEHDCAFRIHVLASPDSMPILEGNPAIDRLIPYSLDEKTPWWKETLYLLKLLAHERYDWVIIANSRKAFHLAGLLKGIPVRMGFRRKWPFLLTHAVADERRIGERHEIEYNLALLTPVLGKVEPRRAQVVLSLSEKAWADGVLREQGSQDNGPLIALSPFSSNEEKEWHPDSFRLLAERLVRESGCRVILLGTSSDEARGRELGLGLGEGVLNLCGKTSIREAAAVIQRSQLMVSNDSGLAHIAAALKTPTITIFRNRLKENSPQRWGPFGEEQTLLQVESGARHRKEPPVEQVFQICLKQLENRKSRI